MFGERLGLLGGVRVRIASVDLELGEHVSGETVLRKHTLDSSFQHALRVGIEDLTRSLAAEAARMPAIGVVLLLVELAAGQLDFIRVDHDDEVAAVDVRGERGLVLAAKDRGDPGGEAPEDLVGCIDDVPVVLDVGRPGDGRAHGDTE